MTDKVQKIREEVERRIIFQKECIKNRHRLTGKPEEEIILEYKQLLSFIDSLQKEPVSEKKCMFTKDIYTYEDRKVLCEDCEEKCEYSKKEEPVNEDLL